MDGILSQEEISALLNDTGSENATQNTSLTDNEKDAIGEIANISMGTAATTLFSLVNRKVEISTPVVSLATWDDIVEAYERPCVFIRIAYTVGLDGNNLLILKENDVKIITDLMMGGDGTNTDGELGELHLSAICEAMNQMMGSAATSLSSMLNKTIDISPPHADLIDLQENVDEGTIDEFLKNPFVKISFKMEIGDLVNSTIMQLYPISFAKEMCASITQNMEQDAAAKKTPSDSVRRISAVSIIPLQMLMPVWSTMMPLITALKQRRLPDLRQIYGFCPEITLILGSHRRIWSGQPMKEPAVFLITDNRDTAPLQDFIPKPARSSSGQILISGH